MKRVTPELMEREKGEGGAVMLHVLNLSSWKENEVFNLTEGKREEGEAGGR